jgi:hypothetical protein
MPEPVDPLTADALGEALRGAAHESRPQFSEPLHQRVLGALQRQQVADASLPAGVPQHRRPVLLAAAVAIVLILTFTAASYLNLWRAADIVSPPPITPSDQQLVADKGDASSTTVGDAEPQLGELAREVNSRLTTLLERTSQPGLLLYDLGAAPAYAQLNQRVPVDAVIGLAFGPPASD